MHADLRLHDGGAVVGSVGPPPREPAPRRVPQAALAPPRVLDGPPGLQLWVFDLGLACCAVEFVAAAMRTEEWPRLGARPSRRRERAHVMVVSGTVTDRLAPAVLEAYAALPEPRYVLSFGACANSGGPYWDSYCVTKGADQLVPVDVYVPGCPPPPEALFDGLRRLLDRVRGD